MKKLKQSRLEYCESCDAHCRIILGEGKTSREFCTKATGLRLTFLHVEAGHLSSEDAVAVEAEIRNSLLPDEGTDPSCEAMACELYVKKILDLVEAVSHSRLAIH